MPTLLIKFIFFCCCSSPDSCVQRLQKKHLLSVAIEIIIKGALEVCVAVRRFQGMCDLNVMFFFF